MFDRLAGERDGSWVMDALRRRWWAIVLIAAVSAAAAYVLSSHQTKKYSATSALLFLQSQLDQELVGKQIIQNNDPTRQAATNQSLVELPTVARRVASQLGISVGRVSSEVSFGSTSTSDVFSVNVTDPVPSVAAAIANSYVTQYIAFRQQANQAQIQNAENLIVAKLAAIPPSQINSPVAQALVADRNELDLLRSAQTGNAQVVETATVPHSPSFPNPKKDGILGLLLGLLVGTGLMAALERRDRRIKTLEELEALYEVPVIGTIPESTALRMGAGTPRDEESFLMIRAQLRYFDVDRDTRLVMITSAESGEGKTLVSLHVARAAARADANRTLLIEADLRRPSLGELIRAERGPGLAELLSHSEDLATGFHELVLTVASGPDAERASGLDVLLAGSIPPNPVELLESRRMAELLEIVRSKYDLVIVDTAPVGVVSDAIPLVHQVDGVIVVSRMGYSRRDHTSRLMKRFRSLNAHILGVVVNSYRAPSDTGYGYYEYYQQNGVEQDSRRFLRARQGQRAR